MKEGPGTIGSPATFWFFLVGSKRTRRRNRGQAEHNIHIKIEAKGTLSKEWQGEQAFKSQYFISILSLLTRLSV